jgi:uncharacterized protein YkwD
LINAAGAGDDVLGMIKRLAATGFLFGLSVVAAPLAPAAAADCGLAGLLSPCVAPLPSPQPAPLPVALPPVLPAPVPATPEPVVTPAPAPAPPAPVAPIATGRSAVPAAADQLLQLVNEARSGAGLPGLTVNSRAASIAAGHSMAMAERGDIYHNPAYLTAATRSSLGARALGENVAMNGSLEAAHQRLMASPGHRANILNGAFDAVGIAVVRDGGTLFITQNFLDSAGTAPSAPAPRTAPKPAAAPAAPRPAAVYRVASAPAPSPVAAAAAPAPASPDAVLSAGPSDGVALAAPGTTALPSTGSRLALYAAAALGLLTSIVGAAIRVWFRG